MAASKGKKSRQKAKSKARRETGKARAANQYVVADHKREVFASEYLGNGFNGVDAARAAGYTGTDASVAVTASRLLKDAKVSTRVRARIEGLAATADEVLSLLGEHLRADLADLADCIGQDGALDLKKAKQLGVSRQLKTMTTRVLTRRLASGAEEREVHTRIELHDSQTAAAHLIKVLGIAQKAGENKGDAERKAKAREDAIRLTMDVYGVGEDDAIRILSGMPEASDLVQ